MDSKGYPIEWIVKRWALRVWSSGYQVIVPGRSMGSASCRFGPLHSSRLLLGCCRLSAVLGFHPVLWGLLGRVVCGVVCQGLIYSVSGYAIDDLFIS